MLPLADVFTKISDPKEKNKLMMDLAASRGEIQAKTEDPQCELFPLRADDYAEDILSCYAIHETKRLKSSGVLILTFFIGGEKYFMQAPYTMGKNKLGSPILKIEGTHPLFHLQRREDYRIRIPTSFKALFEVQTINGQISKANWPLVDLSAGGCRVQIQNNQQTLSLGDEVKGYLYISDRPPINMSSVIRHTRPDPQAKKNLFAGIQFVNVPEIVKNRVAAVVMDLYREFFTKQF